MLKFPVIIPTGLKPVITQPFGDLRNLDFYISKGVHIPFHNGIDVCTSGTNRQTYGCPIIAPSSGWTVYKVYMSSPTAVNGNEVVIRSSPFIDEKSNNITLELRFVHLSWADKGLEGKEVPENTILGYIGNSGLVTPAPTPLKPYAGTHLHLGLIEYTVVNGVLVNLNEKNGVYGLIDPLKYIDINNYITGDEDVLRDMPPLAWGIESLKLLSPIDKIKYVWSVLFS